MKAGPLGILILAECVSCAASNCREPYVERGVEGSGGVELLAGGYSVHDGRGSRDVVGVQARSLFTGFGFGPEGGLLFDAEGGESEALRKREVFLGLWAPIETGWAVHPYIGGGGTGLYGEFAQEGGEVESDHVIAAYVHTGMFINIASSIRIGIDLRAVFGSSVAVHNGVESLDYYQAAVTLGVGFGQTQ